MRIPCAFSVSEDFLKLIDARAKSLDLSRSAYIVQVLRKEILSGSTEMRIVAEEKGTYGSRRAKPKPKTKRKGG